MQFAFLFIFHYNALIMAQKHKLFHSIKIRPRLVGSMVIGVLLYVLLPQDWRQATRVLVAWDAATALYLALTAWMMAHSDSDKIQQRAAQQDEGRLAMLVLTTVTALASLAAIIAELATAKELHGHGEGAHIALAALTVLLSWTFMQTMYALHYAHEYYIEKDGALLGGLDFPDHDNTPDYWDFVYFSFIIGTAAQTADVNISSKLLRRIATLHCVVAFFFNTTILALTVNIGAGLFG